MPTQPIITVTLNPAIDQTVHLGQLTPGAVNIAEQVTLEPGGKGINVASCLADWGIPVIATGLLGQENAQLFLELFAQKNITERFVMLPGFCRSNIKLLCQQQGSTTDINLPGCPVSAKQYQDWLTLLKKLAGADSYVLLAGSLPPGVDEHCYRDLIRLLHQAGLQVGLDTSGSALQAVLAGDDLPDCIKPNQHELAQGLDTRLDSLDAIVQAAQTLHQRGIGQVIVSLGQDGALFVTAEGSWHATGPVITPQSTVGAGDALLAGWLAGQHQQLEIEQNIRLALAFALGKLSQIGPHSPGEEAVQAMSQQIRLHELTRVPQTY